MFYIFFMDKSKLGTEKLAPLMISLALPSIFAQVINILYNIVDRIYIGHLADSSGTAALTGLGICLPIITMISSFSMFAGAGGAPLAAIELGKSEYDSSAMDHANFILGNAFLLLCGFSVLLSALIFIFREPLLISFGASSQTLSFANNYLTVYLCGTFFVLMSVGLNPFIAAQGHSKTAMASTLIGAICNISLDPLFIFAFGMGVKGAALATIISQGISTAWILFFLCSKKSSLQLSARYLKFKSKIILKISALGSSPFIMNITESAIFIVFNANLQKYGGDSYVGAMTIMQSLMSLVYVPVSGFTDGIQPIIGFNYGAKKIHRVKKVILSATAIAFSLSVLFSIIMQINRTFFASMFTNDYVLIELINKLLPIYFGAVWIFGIQMAAQRTFIALGKAKTSIFIALLRKVILLIPLAFILPNFMGVNGIFWAEPIASTISAVTSGTMLALCYGKLKEV